jgi:integrase
MPKFWIKTVLMETGERLPLLRSTDGPLFAPTLFAVSLRAKSSAANTIQQAMRSVAVLQQTLDRLRIDLNQRIAQGKYLTLHEVDQVVADAKLQAGELDKQLGLPTISKLRRVLSLEQARLNKTRTRPPGEVSSNTTAIRLYYIRTYLNWHIQVRALRLDTSPAMRADILELGKLVDKVIREKTPSTTGNIKGERLGLTVEAQQLLLQVIEPNHPLNPWASPHSKERNELIVHMLLELGVRRGELLGIRTSDIRAQRQEVNIELRPDDKDDPRLYEPNGKTKDRILAVSEQLLRRITTYVQGQRYDIKLARKNPFLLVASTGEPLSISGLNKIFAPLQESTPELGMVIPHLMRHTFNDNIVGELESSGMKDALIVEALCRLNGWTDRSLMPFKYTKRSGETRAKAALRKYQEKLNMGSSNE